MVKKKSVGNFPITFSPKWICESEARLELTNPLTNDKFEYDLKGVGEEPVAEDHIVINCKARETTQHDIELKNPYPDKDITYRVDTDLINATGPKSVTVKAGKRAKYPLKVTPVLSGQYTGSITFFETEEIYIWYTVLLNTDSPHAVKSIDMSALIRQASAFDIELSNPLPKPITFDVIINGDFLIGESSFFMQP